MYAVLAEESLTRLCSNTESTMDDKDPPCSSVTSSNRFMRLQSCVKAMGWCTAQCKMLQFCVKIIVKESRNFELLSLHIESTSMINMSI